MHLNYLDGIRAVAALYVLIHHILMQIKYEKSTCYNLLSNVFQHGRFAVDVFIVLSGFCLIIPLAKGDNIKSTNAFLKRRAVRILPTYYAAMALSLILIYTVIGDKTGSHWDVSIPVTFWDIFTHFFLLQDLSGETAYKINHTFWSISVECRIYIFFPIIIELSKKFGIAAVTFSSIPLSLILGHTYSYIGLNSYTMAPHYLSLFMFGALACYISFTENKFYRRLKELYLEVVTLGLIIFIIIIIAIVPFLFPEVMFSSLTSDYIVGICAALLLLSMSTGKMSILTNFFSWYPLVFIGTFAYSIYLTHAPVLQVISQYLIIPSGLSNNFNLASMIIVGVFSSIIVAYLFFILFEKPFIKKRNLIKAF